MTKSLALVWWLLLALSGSVFSATTAPVFDSVAPSPGAFTLSGDGRVAAHISAGGNILIWDTARLNPLETLPAGSAPPGAVALNADGSLLAIGYPEGRLLVRSRPEKKTLREYYGHSGHVLALTFSPDGQMLASGATDGTTQLWEVTSGRRLQVFDSRVGGDGSNDSGSPITISFSGDGRGLIVNEWYQLQTYVGRGMTLWDIKDGVEISTREVAAPGHADWTMRQGQALGGRGWWLVYTGYKGLMIERLDRCGEALTLPADVSADTVAADPLGRWAAYATEKELHFVAAEGSKKTMVVALPAQAIALYPDAEGRSVFALGAAVSDSQAASNSALYRISVPPTLLKAQPLAVEDNPSLCPATAAVRAQQDFRLPEQRAALVPLAKLTPTREMSMHSGNNGREFRQTAVSGLVFDQQQLVALHSTLDMFGSPRDDSSVVVWDVSAQKPAGIGPWQRVHRLFPAKSGWFGWYQSTVYQNLLTGKPLFRAQPNTASSDSAHVQEMPLVFDRDTGEAFRPTPTHIERYTADGRRLKNLPTQNAMALAARNGRLAALDQKGKVQLWQLEPKPAVRTYTITMSGEWTDGLALSADGRYLWASHPSPCGPTEYAVYRLGVAQPIAVANWLALFPARSNRNVVADARAHRIAVWDLDQGAIIARLPRQRNRDQDGRPVPLQAAISDDGRLVASASLDGLVRVWDLDARQLIGEARVGGAVSALIFDGDGKRLAVGRTDGQIVIYTIPPA